MARFMDRLTHAWEVFQNGRPQPRSDTPILYGSRRDLRRFNYTNSQIITPIITQISIDGAGVELRHVRTGEDGEYLEDIKSGLNKCLTVSPNLDQSPSQFRQDVISTMLREGVVAIVPVITDYDPDITGGYDIKNLRVGRIIGFNAQEVHVDLYNEWRGTHQEVWLPKAMVAIVENPLYDIMNAPNSTLQRLMHKLNQLDVTDERIASGKLDIILQLPYTIKHETKRKEAELRRKDLEEQLTGSAYGIGYIDATERITQLNRPSENQLLAQVKDLEDRVNAQLGLTPDIFFGTADEAAMLNYQNRTVLPIVRAIREEMARKFLTKTARTKKQSVLYFRNPFALVPVSQIAEIADKFTRNEIMSPNEFRPIVGLRPVDDPKANELRNRNMPAVDPVAPEESSKQLEPPVPEEGNEPDEEA